VTDRREGGEARSSVARKGRRRGRGRTGGEGSKKLLLEQLYCEYEKLN